MAKSLFHIFPNEHFVDMGLYQYGWEHCEPLHSYGPYTRNHYLFHYVISGTGTLISTNSSGATKEYKLYSGQGFLIQPRQVNTYCADETSPWKYTWLEFDGARVREALELAGLSIDSPIYKPTSKELSNQLKEEILYIVQHEHASPFELIGHLYLFMDLLTKSNINKKTLHKKTLRDYYVEEAITYIEQNYQDNFSIENIADFCNLNRSYFGTIFKTALGQTPQEFLMHYRMSKAAQFLKSTHYSISDIGSSVGYPNQLHFSRAFKRIYGVSPRLWRSTNAVFSSNADKT